MEAKIVHLDRLLELLSKKTRQPLTHKGYEEMSKILGEDTISKSYLYENIYDKKKKARKRGEVTLKLQISKLDYIASHLGFTSYREFAETMDAPIDPILSSCVGSYYSYVRQNDELGIVLRSPVKIVIKEGKVQFELKGGKSTFTGEIQ